MTADDDQPGLQTGAWLFLRHLDEQSGDMPPRPSSAAMSEAVALLAGRAYQAANLGLSGDVEPVDLVRALVNIGTALLREFDEGEAFLKALGAEAVGRPEPERP